MYFTPLIVASILIGVWGLQITARMITPYLPEHKIMPKYFAIQLVLIFCKLQPAIIDLICFIINAISKQRLVTEQAENSEYKLPAFSPITLADSHKSQLKSKAAIGFRDAVKTARISEFIPFSPYKMKNCGTVFLFLNRESSVFIRSERIIVHKMHN